MGKEKVSTCGTNITRSEGTGTLGGGTLKAGSTSILAKVEDSHRGVVKFQERQ